MFLASYENEIIPELTAWESTALQAYAEKYAADKEAFFKNYPEAHAKLSSLDWFMWLSCKDSHWMISVPREPEPLKQQTNFKRTWSIATLWLGIAISIRDEAFSTFQLHQIVRFGNWGRACKNNIGTPNNWAIHVNLLRWEIHIIPKLDLKNCQIYFWGGCFCGIVGRLKGDMFNS